MMHVVYILHVTLDLGHEVYMPCKEFFVTSTYHLFTIVIECQESGDDYIYDCENSTCFG